MPKFLLQVNYTLDGVKGVLSKGGSARRAAAQAAAESLGGTLESMYFAFGSTDAIAIAELPDNSAAAALALTAGGSGAATAIHGGAADARRDRHRYTGQVQYTPPGQ